MDNNYYKLIEEKLTKLGVTSKYAHNQTEEITKLKISEILPKDYKEFLFNFGTLDFKNNEIIICPPNSVEKEPISFINFYGLNIGNHNLNTIIRRYQNRIPSDLIPIAECPGGDQICIGIAGNALGEIYHWNHEKEKLHLNSPKEIWEPLTLLFTSFYQLIMSLKKIEETEDINDSSIVKINISDKFLSRLKK